MKKNTEKNREEMAAYVVGGMDLDAVVEYAQGQLEEFYEDLNAHEFDVLWKEVFGEE